jgi:cell division protein FtsI/penicillin-binding protein 2
MHRCSGNNRVSPRRLLAAVCALAVLAPAVVQPASTGPADLDASSLVRALTPHLAANRYPEQVLLSAGGQELPATIRYTFDRRLQDTLRRTYDLYDPDYGAFVAINPDTGEILAMYSHTRAGLPDPGNLALRASSPAASVFKIVTAAAALDRGLLDPDSVLPYVGRSHSLYRGQVLGAPAVSKTTKASPKTPSKAVSSKRGKTSTSAKSRRRAPVLHQVTLTDAFADSINPVFARIGVQRLGATSLNDYAGRFGFNRNIACGVEMPVSATGFARGDLWDVAEAASGYTRATTMSPLHGAMIAGTAINEGMMMRPQLVDTVVDSEGLVMHLPQPQAWGRAIAPDAALKLRRLMTETVQTGTARRSFADFFEGPLARVEVGGKTGTLNGEYPRGRNDWFVGYATDGQRRIAFASHCVHQTETAVKSAFVARRVLETFFSSGGGEAISSALTR